MPDASESNFSQALKIILAEEGGYSNDSRDPGGKTRYGVTEEVARAHGYYGDMRELPLPLAQNIYFTEYWSPVKGDQLPWPLSLYVFDCAVNQGVDAAKKILQRALDTPADGIIGQTTLRLAQKSTPWHWARFMALRALRYQGTRNFDRFGPGWLTRLFSIAGNA